LVVGDFDGDGRDKIGVQIGNARGNPQGSEGNDFWIMKWDGEGWVHMDPQHRNHPQHADLDISEKDFPIKSPVCGRFDKGKSWSQIAGIADGNDLWVMEYP